MNATKFIAALAAAGTVAVVSSQAEALVCFAPIPGAVADTVAQGAFQRLKLSCQSRTTAGTLTRVAGHGTGNDNRVITNLTEGPGYARTAGYNSSQVAMGCVAQDNNPTSTSSANADCGARVHYIAMEIGN